MKEYFIENGKEVNISDLKADFMSNDAFINANKSLAIICHDVFIKYKGGILLIKRRSVPAKNIL